MDEQSSLYDSDDYYDNDGKASRLRYGNGLILYLDRLKAKQVVKRTGLKSGRALDVGAGDGKYLYFLKRIGFEVRGTTASARARDAAKSRYGIDLALTTLLPEDIRQFEFDVVSYWHVFEHLESERDHTRHWNALVRRGGYLVIEVPNLTGLGARLCYRSWLGSDETHHVNQKTPGEIRAVLAHCGFQVYREESFSLKFSYLFLWSALLGKLFGRRYDFRNVFLLLKDPFVSLRARPAQSANGIAALFYFAPVVLPLLLWQSVTRSGEVARIYARKTFAAEGGDRRA